MQTLLPHAAPVNPVTLVTEPKVIPSSQKVRAPEHKLVRTDSRMLTLDHFMKPITAEPVAVGSVSSVTNVIDDEFEEFAADDVSPEDLIALDQGDVQRDSCASNDVETLPDNQGITKVRLTSVLSLRQALEDNEHSGITSLFQEHIFVGVVDEQRALIQYQTKLLMVNFVKLR